MTNNDFYSWLAGFIDGEGYFTLFKSKKRPDIQPRFGLGQRADDEALLERIRFRVGLGRLHHQKPKVLTNLATGKQYWQNGMVYWEITNVAECVKLVRLLDEYPLQSRKRLDYQLWREVVLDKWARGQNSDHPGQKAFRTHDHSKDYEAYVRLREQHGYKKLPVPEGG